MNQDSFKDFLTDESRLYAISYEELKSLTLAYPYSSLLRLLLLKKSYLDQHKDYERNLQTAALYTTDRRNLYQTVQALKSMPLQKEYVTLGEDYLELAELSRLEKVLSVRHVSETLADKKTYTSARTEESETFPGINKSPRDVRAHLDVPSFQFQEPDAADSIPELPALQDEDSLKLTVDLNPPPAEDQMQSAYPAPTNRSNLPQFKPAYLPEEKSKAVDLEITNPDRARVQEMAGSSKPLAPTFSGWLKQFRMDVDAIATPAVSPVNSAPSTPAVEKERTFEPGNLPLEDSDDPYLPVEPDEKDMDQRAVNSAYLSEDVISETLAMLLALQGRNDLAIDMYKKLSLQFPDKSSFFASKIKILVDKPGEKPVENRIQKSV